MNNDINHEWQLEHLEHGTSRIAAIKMLIAQADGSRDHGKSMRLRDALIRESVFYSDSLDSVIVFPELLKLFDDHPDSGYDARSLMWCFKYIIENAPDFSQLSYSKCFEFFDLFKQRLEQYGYSLRTYYHKLTCLYLLLDPTKINDTYARYLQCRRDTISDCPACEKQFEVTYTLVSRGIEEALTVARPILANRMTCAEVPQITYVSFLCYYICVQDESNARVFFEKVYDLISGDIDFLRNIFELLLYCRYWDHDKGIECFCENAANEAASHNAFDCFHFSLGAYHFWNALAKERETVSLNLPIPLACPHDESVYRCSELAAYYYRRALTFADRLDARNRTNFCRMALEDPLSAPEGLYINPIYLF